MDQKKITAKVKEEVQPQRNIKKRRNRKCAADESKNRPTSFRHAVAVDAVAAAVVVGN